MSQHSNRESVNSGLDYWNGLLDWTTGLTLDLKFSHNYFAHFALDFAYLIKA